MTVAIYKDIPRPKRSDIALLEGMSVADIHDALPPTARAAGLLRDAVRPLVPGQRICGPAVTALCAPGDSLMSHCALYLAQAGDVLVISSGGPATNALWGGNVAYDAKLHGIAGVIVDGPVRDVAVIRKLKLPVWSSSVSVMRGEKKGHGTVNAPIPCGGCVVNPGDIIVADDDGVIAFSAAQIKETVANVRPRLHLEAKLRRQIRQGKRLFETQDFAKTLADAGIQITPGCWSAPSQ